MSAIEWTDQTWNPVTGCDRVSPGCAHCYALELAPRLRAMGLEKYRRARDGDPRTSGPAFGVTLHPDTLDEPRHWRKPRRVFVNSMSDLFHEEIPYEYIREVFNVMRCCDGSMTAAGDRMPRHTFQVLTKRPERMRDLALSRRLGFDPEHPPSNVWLGTSIENRRFVHRAEVLAETPAAVRFISAEPLLGPLIPEAITVDGQTGQPTYRWKDGYTGPGLSFYNRDGELAFDWLIAGGESGPEHRPIEREWVRDLRDVCEHEGVAFFFKQWGGRTPKAGGRVLDGRTWDEFPLPESLQGAEAVSQTGSGGSGG